MIIVAIVFIGVIAAATTPASAATLILAIVFIGVIAATATSAPATFAVVIAVFDFLSVIVRRARLAVVDGAIAPALEAVCADIIISIGRAWLAVVDGAIAAALEAVCTDIIVNVGYTRLAVVDRAIAPALETILANVVIRQRAGATVGWRGGLRRRALGCKDPGNHASGCSESQTSH
jgi:hypothetical protein